MAGQLADAKTTNCEGSDRHICALGYVAIMSSFVSLVTNVLYFTLGATLTATGACTTFRSLAALRLLLGIFESALNPGFVLITSSWWKREEQPFRVGLWYSANGFIGAPSGAIFYAIAHLHVGHTTHTYLKPR